MNESTKPVFSLVVSYGGGPAVRWQSDTEIANLADIEGSWLGVAEAAAALGRPPHWADLGFVPIEGAVPCAWGRGEIEACPHPEGAWRLYSPGLGCEEFYEEFFTEDECRQAAVELLATAAS